MYIYIYIYIHIFIYIYIYTHIYKYDIGANILLPLCKEHGTTFSDTHSKIPPDSSIYGSKATA